LSADAVQVRVTEFEVMLEEARFVGVEGGVVSVVAGVVTERVEDWALTFPAAS
jgi:hypothetical protein